MQKRLASGADGRRSQDRRHLRGGPEPARRRPARLRLPARRHGRQHARPDLHARRCCSRASRPRSRSASARRQPVRRGRHHDRAGAGRRRGRPAGAGDRRLADRPSGTSSSPTPWPTTPPAASTSSARRAGRSTSSSRATSRCRCPSTARCGRRATAPPAWATRWRRCAGWPYSATASATRSGRPRRPVRCPGPVRAVRPGRPRRGVDQRVRAAQLRRRFSASERVRAKKTDEADRRHRRARQHRHRPDVQAAAQSEVIEPRWMIGVDPTQRGLELAARPGARGEPRGRRLAAQAGRAARPDLRGDLGLRAPRVRAALRGGRHPRVDLTPAAVGPAVIPPVNGEEHLGAMNVNMITCGGQATIPMVAAVSRRRHGVVRRDRRLGRRRSRPARAPAPTSTSSPAPRPPASSRSAAPSGARRSSSSTRPSRR